jgi:glucose-1-phosphate cytidylyltransferase
MKPSEIPVFILCGGMGTRLKEQTEFIPKPMVTVGNQPILFHIMNTYSKFGFKKFIICLGFKADTIKSYFLNFYSLNADFTINLKTNDLKVHSHNHDFDWDVTLADTGENSMTGSRIAQAASKYLGKSEHFAVTYGDGLTDADLGAELQFHLSHSKPGTVLGINPPSRFGEIKTKDDQVTKFYEKPEFTEKWISGGYFFFKKEFLKYLSEDESCILERAPLINLADDGHLKVFKHNGFWECMDTQRDRDHLESICKSGKIPWQ